MWHGTLHSTLLRTFFNILPQLGIKSFDMTVLLDVNLCECVCVCVCVCARARARALVRACARQNISALMSGLKEKCNTNIAMYHYLLNRYHLNSPQQKSQLQRPCSPNVAPSSCAAASYSEGREFKYRPEDRLYWAVFMVFLNPRVKFRGSTLKQATTFSSHSIPK
jgi:hypothetical protein